VRPEGAAGTPGDSVGSGAAKLRYFTFRQFVQISSQSCVKDSSLDDLSHITYGKAMLNNPIYPRLISKEGPPDGGGH
jgi:hypothetical protein